MFRAMAVDSSVISIVIYMIYCFSATYLVMRSGALGSPDLLLLYSVIALALHKTIILILTLTSLSFNP